MSKWTKILIYTLIVIAVGGLVIYPLIKSDSKDSKEKGKNAGKQQQGPALVKGKILKYDSFSSEIKVMGKIIADEWVDLSPEVSGKIIKINFKEGGNVAKGQLLVKINDNDLQAQLKKNEVRLELSAQKLDRQKKLLEVNGTTKEEFDNVKFEFESIMADIELIKAHITKTEIRAPFAGQIGLRYLSEGAYVAPGTKIATLQSKSKLKIDFTIPQNYSIYLNTGKIITFSTGKGSEEMNASIYALEPGVDQTTATLKARAFVTSGGKGLIPGKVVEVSVKLTAPVQTILIPTETLIPEISGQSVFLYRGGKSVSVPVEIGDRTEKVVQIMSGINPGDTLIVSGLIQLKNGGAVKLTAVENQGKAE
ncbi:efflux RND transporter periplasmic adaptor subunit [Ignavibacteriales bacterium]